MLEMSDCVVWLPYDCCMSSPVLSSLSHKTDLKINTYLCEWYSNSEAVVIEQLNNNFLRTQIFSQFKIILINEMENTTYYM